MKNIKKLKDDLVSCYDNGDLMIEIFEEYYDARKCNNCKYWNPSEFDKMEANGDGYIDCDEVYVESRGTINIDNFCCSKWESK